MGIAYDIKSAPNTKLVKKHQRSFKGFDDKILSMYARGMSVRDIQAHLAEIWGTECAIVSVTY